MAPPCVAMHPPTQQPSGATSWDSPGLHGPRCPLATQVPSPGHWHTDDRSPGTFSPTNQRGRSSSRMRATCHQSPDRSPARPARRPATEKSWQGQPAVRIPRPGTNPTARRSSPVTFVTSSNWWASGKCRRLIAAAALSISTAATVRTPARANARGKPPMPSNREAKVRLTGRSSQKRRIPRSWGSELHGHAARALPCWYRLA